MGVTTFVTTFLGVFSLYFAGIALWQQALDLAWTWWVSVYVGMLLVTPMCVIAFQQWRRTNGEPLMWGVASTLIGLSLLVFMLARNDAAQKTGAHLNADASETAHVIREAFLENEDLFVALRAFFESSSKVDRKEFSEFVLPLLGRSPSIAAMGWAPRVTGAARSAFESTLSKSEMLSR